MPHYPENTYATRTPRTTYASEGQPAPKPRNKFVPKGHDAQLSEAQYNKLETAITLMSGDTLTGHVTKRDKWTITILQFDHLNPVIIYKHAIETVVIKQPKAAEAGAVQ